VTGIGRRYPTHFRIGEECFTCQFPRKSSSRSYEPGDVVYLMRRIPTFHGYDQQWAVHELVLPEEYWTYCAWARRTPKEQRMHPYVARAQTYFRGAVFIDKL
jgi:hypothetical protein